MNARTDYTTVAMWPTVRILAHGSFNCICKLATNCKGRPVTLTSIRVFILFFYFFLFGLGFVPFSFSLFTSLALYGLKER